MCGLCLGVSEDDGDVRGALANHVRRTAGTSHRAAEGRTFVNHDALEHELIGGKVHLELWVKVRENWTEDTAFLRELGMGAESL